MVSCGSLSEALADNDTESAVTRHGIPDLSFDLLVILVLTSEPLVQLEDTVTFVGNALEVLKIGLEYLYVVFKVFVE